MDDVSYFSDDDESVCVGLTFTCNSNKLAQSSTNSTDSGVECAERPGGDWVTTHCNDSEMGGCESADGVSVGEGGDRIGMLEERSVIDLSNIDNKCETDSGCEMKQPSPYLEEMYPGFGELKLIKAKKQELGGVKGGKIVSLNTRSLDILNGKLDDPSSKTALRPNPMVYGDRKDKPLGDRTPPQRSRRNKSGGIVYENVSSPAQKPRYVNYKPSRFGTPQKSDSPAISSHYLTPMTKIAATPSSKQSELSKPPLRRDNAVRYSCRTPPSRRSDFSSPHHYEQITSPDGMSAVGMTRDGMSREGLSRDAISRGSQGVSPLYSNPETPAGTKGLLQPRQPPRLTEGSPEKKTVSSKSASPGEQSPGAIGLDLDWSAGDNTIDRSIRSYHEAVRRVPTTSTEHRSSSPSRDSPVYCKSTENSPYGTYTTRGRGNSPARHSPRAARYSPGQRSTDECSPGQLMKSGTRPSTSPDSTGQCSTGQRSTGHLSTGRLSTSPGHFNDTLDKTCLVRRAMDAPTRGREYANRRGETVYDTYQNSYDRHNPPALNGRHNSVDSSQGFSTGSLSDSEFPRPVPRKKGVRRNVSQSSRNVSQSSRNVSQSSRNVSLSSRNVSLSSRNVSHAAKNTERTKSRFDYSVAKPVTQSPDELLDISQNVRSDKHGKQGVVLIQATLEDVQSLFKLQDNIFELRFSDSGLTSDLIQLLSELCLEKHISRLIFEDCEMDDWDLLYKTIDQNDISHIGFHDTNVGDEGTTRLAQIMSTSATLVSIDLVKCRVGCSGVAALGVALMQNTSLVSLNLSDNPFLTKGAVLFFRALKGGNSTLQNLSLSSTCCGSVEVVLIICAVLLRNTSLSHLDLNFTELSEDSVTLIAESLSHNTNLSSLCLSGNGLGDSAAHEVAVTLADTNSLLHMDLSGNKLSWSGLHVLIQSSTVHGKLETLDISNNQITPLQHEDLVNIVEDLALVGVAVL